MLTDAVMFDIDGTLWDASAASAEGWNQALEELGLQDSVTAEQIAMVAGSPFETCVDTLLPGLRTKHPQLLEALSSCERASVERRGGAFYEGALGAVAQLARGLDVFLISNCQDWYMDLFLDFSCLGPLLSGIDCYGRSSLPKSEMLSSMQSSHSCRAPVYVGDTAGDEAAAQLAGIAHIHVSWGFGQAVGESLTVNSFAELLSCLRRAGDERSPGASRCSDGALGGRAPRP